MRAVALRCVHIHTPATSMQACAWSGMWSVVRKSEAGSAGRPCVPNEDVHALGAQVVISVCVCISVVSNARSAPQPLQDQVITWRVLLFTTGTHKFHSNRLGAF